MKAAPARMTLTLLGLTAVGYVAVAAVDRGGIAPFVGGFVPARLTGLTLTGALPVWMTPLSATLLHGNILHLVFNLLMLGYCGKQDEVALGAGGTALLYVVGAYAAAAAQFVVTPHSGVPMIGASGAISALVGAYALLYGQRRPSRLSPELARWLHVVWLAVTWVVVQLLVGLASATAGMAIAAAAHVGGFVAGLILARPLLRWRYRAA